MPMPTFALEVCVDSLEGAIAYVLGLLWVPFLQASLEINSARDGGATRLEICSALATGGGLTPSLGLVKSIKSVVPDLDLMIMIRPRMGDFCYSHWELRTMHEDISSFKAEGVLGVVLGVLTPDGTVDIPSTKRYPPTAALMNQTELMIVTFHRAIDMTTDGRQALIDIGSIPGIQRVLTSGLRKTALEGCETLRELQLLNATQQLGLTIMIGSGINSRTVIALLESLSSSWDVGEFHMSGGAWAPGRSIIEGRRQGMNMGPPDQNEWNIWVTDSTRVKDAHTAIYNFMSQMKSKGGDTYLEA